MRRISGAVGLVYALLVIGMNLGQLNRGVTTLAYAALAVVVPTAVLAGDRLASRGHGRADVVAQLGLGVMFGMWALPSTSGLVALLALAAGVWSALRMRPLGWSRALALVAGIGVGVGILLLSFSL